MTKLARTAFLGAAEETTNGTYLAPTFAIPFLKASYETITEPLKDESVRGNDAVLQGLYAGPQQSSWDLELHAYPDILGYWLRMIGPDTVTAGTSTTLSANSLVGATSISTAVTITSGSTIKIGTGAAIEYAVTGAPTGTGPFTIPITTPATGLVNAHNTSDPVVSQSTHTFAQSFTTRPPSFSFTVYDNIDYRSWSGLMMTELQIKIDPKNTVTVSPKFIGFPEATASTFTNTYSTNQPVLGWQWTVTNAGGSSTRGLSMDITTKRAGEAIHSSDGVQAPRETFVGALEMDGAYKAIYENTTDMSLFLNYTQTPTVHTITKPTSLGGESLAITMSQSGYHKATRDLAGVYVMATFDLSAIYNSTDVGIAKAVLKNFQTTAY